MGVHTMGEDGGKHYLSQGTYKNKETKHFPIGLNKWMNNWTILTKSNAKEVVEKSHLWYWCVPAPVV